MTDELLNLLLSFLAIIGTLVVIPLGILAARIPITLKYIRTILKEEAAKIEQLDFEALHTICKKEETREIIYKKYKFILEISGSIQQNIKSFAKNDISIIIKVQVRTPSHILSDYKLVIKTKKIEQTLYGEQQRI